MSFLMQQPSSQNYDILSLMKQSKIYWQVKKQLIASILKSSTSTNPDKQKISIWQPSIEQILKALIATQNQEKITGLITNCLQKSTRRMPIEVDSNPEIEIYRHKWSQMISKEFNIIASRIIKNEEYDQQDESQLVSIILSISKNQDINSCQRLLELNFQNDILKITKYQQIRNKYSFLTSNENIIGADKDYDIKDRQKKAMKIVDGQNIASQIENYLCYGSVPTERVNVYRRYFQCFYEYNGKRVDWNLYEKVWKPILRLDCKQILKDPQYFVFKEEMQKVYKLFICDKQLCPDPQLDKYSPIHHIIPCKSFSCYIAPFCYTSLSPQDIYELFREFYCEYLINLNVISSSPDGILSLCLLFEELLYTTEKKLVTKFEALGIQPLRLVFPWIFYCFIGYLHIEQLFLMMDRIIGMKSLQILPLYCVSVLFKCKSEILDAKNQSQIIEIVLDAMKEDVWIQTVRDFFKYHL